MSTVRLDDRTAEAKKDAADDMRKALTEAAIHLEGEIAARTPENTGHLRASISHIAPLGRSNGEKKAEMLGGTAGKDEAYVGTNVEYAPYVEFGTKYQKPQPYMRTGFAAARKALEMIIRRRMKRNG